MGHYYFDFDDGNRSFRDDRGIKTYDLNVVRNEAIGSLPGMTGVVFLNGEHRISAVQVRDEFALDTESDEWPTPSH